MFECASIDSSFLFECQNHIECPSNGIRIHEPGRCRDGIVWGAFLWRRRRVISSHIFYYRIFIYNCKLRYTLRIKVSGTALSGVYLIDVAPHSDERGIFARTWDPEIAKEHGLLDRFDYSCISTNVKQGTLRGMHYQKDPHGEVKLVRCTRGAIFDVAVDLRPDSPTFKKWVGIELTADNHRALYIPPGCAHGFLTLAPGAEILYMISGMLVPLSAAGVRFDDPAFAIRWPLSPAVIADRDTAYPDFQP